MSEHISMIRQNVSGLLYILFRFMMSKIVKRLKPFSSSLVTQVIAFLLKGIGASCPKKGQE